MWPLQIPCPNLFEDRKGHKNHNTQMKPSRNWDVLKRCVGFGQGELEKWTLNGGMCRHVWEAVLAQTTETSKAKLMSLTVVQAPFYKVTEYISTLENILVKWLVRVKPM